MLRRDNDNWDASAIIAWLLTETRAMTDTDTFVHSLGQSMTARGSPVWRIRLSIRTLHPLVAAVTTVWERDRGETRTSTAKHGIEGRPAYLGSPLQIIDQTNEPFRCNLTRIDEKAHTSLIELRDRGGTDYYGVPMPFRNGSRGVLVFVTDTPSGFSSSDIRKLDRISSVVALVAEIINAGHSAISVAEAYLGSRTARRVLDGQITRGNFDTIQAAILFSDIRRWTEINNRLAPDQALALVNGYFERVGAAIQRHNGEILKFLGDGVLAVFPIEDIRESPATACQNALDAAIQCTIDIEFPGLPEPIDIGVGLHYGEVLYGNVGSEDRIDFTVLGKAVNVAARIEGCCDRLKEPILFSREFADQVQCPTRSVSFEELKGCEKPVEVLSVV